MKFDKKITFSAIFLLAILLPMASAATAGVEEGDSFTWSWIMEAEGGDYDGSVEMEITIDVTEVDEDTITFDIVWIFISADGEAADYYEYDADEEVMSADDVEYTVIDDICAEESFGAYFIDSECEELTYEDSETDGDYEATLTVEYDDAGVLKLWKVEATDGDETYLMEISRGGIPSYPAVVLGLFSAIGISALIIKKRK